MSLKELRKQAGIKQSELAVLSGVNLRSIQDYEQGHKSIASAKGETLFRLSYALGCSIEDIIYENVDFIDIKSNNEARMACRAMQYANSIRDRKNKIVHFPIIVPDEIVDMSRVYPTKQAQVKNVIDTVRGDDRISFLRLFGSSINMSCNKNSDLDFAVDLTETSKAIRNDISEKIQIACGWDADIIWLDHLSKSERIYNDIMKGLVII